MGAEKLKFSTLVSKINTFQTYYDLNGEQTKQGCLKKSLLKLIFLSIRRLYPTRYTSLGERTIHACMIFSFQRVAKYAIIVLFILFFSSTNAEVK